MARRVIAELLFSDGREERVLLRPLALIAAERQFKGKPPPYEGTLWAAWHQLRPGTPFEEWAEDVDALEEVIEDRPPQPATASPDSSQQ